MMLESPGTPAHTPALDMDDPLSLSLSPPRGERVPKAEEGNLSIVTVNWNKSLGLPVSC
jgi:hypothetical protein